MTSEEVLQYLENRKVQQAKAREEAAALAIRKSALEEQQHELAHAVSKVQEQLALHAQRLKAKEKEKADEEKDLQAKIAQLQALSKAKQDVLDAEIQKKKARGQLLREELAKHAKTEVELVQQATDMDAQMQALLHESPAVSRKPKPAATAGGGAGGGAGGAGGGARARAGGTASRAGVAAGAGGNEGDKAQAARLRVEHYPTPKNYVSDPNIGWGYVYTPMKKQIYDAVVSGNIENLTRLCKEWAGNLLIDEHIDEKGENALHKAADIGNEEVRVTSNTYKKQNRNTSLSSPLSLYIKTPFYHTHTKLKAVRVLIAANANINKANNAGRTALNIATVKGHVSIVRLLIAEGALGTAEAAAIAYASTQDMRVAIAAAAKRHKEELEATAAAQRKAQSKAR